MSETSAAPRLKLEDRPKTPPYPEQYTPESRYTFYQRVERPEWKAEYAAYNAAYKLQQEFDEAYRAQIIEELMPRFQTQPLAAVKKLLNLFAEIDADVSPDEMPDEIFKLEYSEGGGEGGGESVVRVYSIVGVPDVFVQFEGYYASYDGTTWADEPKLVKPYTFTETRYK